MKPSTPAAVATVEEAMNLVKQAQRGLDEAGQMLSRIRSGSDLMDRAFALHESAQKLWWRLNQAAKSRDGMSLDSEPE